MLLYSYQMNHSFKILLKFKIDLCWVVLFAKASVQCVSSKTLLLGVMLNFLLGISERSEHGVAKYEYIITTWPWKTNHDSLLCLSAHSFSDATSFYIAQRLCKHKINGWEAMVQKRLTSDSTTQPPLAHTCSGKKRQFWYSFESLVVIKISKYYLLKIMTIAL